MIAILSPAKRLDTEPEKALADWTRPHFEEEAEKLVKRAREYDVDGLKALMNVSDKLAELNHQRFAEWHQGPSPEEGKRALLAFQGDVYQGLGAGTLTEEAFERAQDKLRILSGLYGILRPKDLIMPYRLEMSTKLANERGEDLYRFWGDRLTEAMKEELEADEDGVLIDLASNEYSKAIDKKQLGMRVITPKFLQKKDGKYKTIPMKAKRARGLMARFMVEEHVQDPEDLKAFDLEGYRYNQGMSEEDIWVFTREG
ncbi:MAG: peroxide stress protein YaaA [Flavobacteriales bacterium]